MKKYVILLIFSLLFLLLCFDVMAQCPMCKSTLESNMSAGGSAGRGINRGILYLLAAPYLLAMALGIWWWRNRQIVKRQQIKEEQTSQEPTNLSSN
ncbi:MAG: hypothetical protein IPI59_11195 [Sphingobacteriales bacterium]|jgi:hypothetical protein|nr:hypothetical protein [Sphingobacteriales bacterium]MBK6889403.1 hypothetical protein [Sphingobacteriales bacterium]MBK7528097.1 hypothetical protein [Sphingobacteriales bacterium]MBK8679721.1 hypothetical protein [Sphingobacteriales bacterium]MBL0246175.1 hypothetical protein [Sphingobacteriales bacterium]